MDQLASRLRRRIAVAVLGVATTLCLTACQTQEEADQEEPTVQDQNDSDQTGDDEDEQADAGSDDEDEEADTGPDDEDEPEADTVELADDGEANFEIVIGDEPDSTVQLAAEELAEYLEKISGADFEIVEGDGAEGIVVGTADDFETLPVDAIGLDDISFGDGPFELEDYLVRTVEEQGVYLVGASPLAVRFAVWDLLYELGHRQFFPTDTWEVIPEDDELSVAVDTFEQPDYYNRQAPRGAMRMDVRDWASDHWEDWQIRNRTMDTFDLETGHAYDSVIADNQEAFDNNPEYWGLVDGQRTSNAQPNVANEDVQQMFIDFALGRLEDNPGQDSVPMDPRDGDYWSESDESLAIGGPSEQAVFLANLVAEEVVDEYGDDKYVGMYGYSHHSPPPEIDVHPNVIVSLATSYIRGGYTFEEMLDGWSERTEMIGIREYYGIWEWHYSLPGKARAADTEYLAETIPDFHDEGARFINAESNDTWGGYGLGYYLASRMLWDVDEAEQVDELIDDFVDKAFESAAGPMADFYALIDGSSADPHVPDRQRPLNEDMVGRMYRLLDEARQMAGDNDEVLDRIDDLILYTRYVEMYRQFDATEGADRQEIFDDLVSFAWRMRDTMMAESVALSRYIDREVRTDDHLEWGDGYTTNKPADRHREDEDEPFDDDEIETILQDGIDNNDLVDLDFEPWVDDGELEPAGLAPDERGELEDRANRGDVEAVIHTDDGTLPELTISAGHIYDDRGPVQWLLKDEDGEIVDFGDVPPDQQEHHFELEESDGGIYRFSIENTGQGFIWDYEPRGAKLTLLAGGPYELARNWYDRLYFYVPEGSEDIHMAGTILEGRYDFIDGTGQAVDADDIDVIQDYTRVDVPEGRDGEVWALEIVSLPVEIRFLDVPGYVALSPDELVLPEEATDEL